jgi:hypothetical protein
MVVFDGQSLNLVPSPSYPTLAMQGLGGVDFEIIAVNGASWTLLSEDVEDRRDPLGDDGYSVLVMVGGTSDVVGGDDGPTIYADMRDYAASARAAGYDRIIAATIQPAWGEDAVSDGNRLEANRLLLEDADGAFDEVVDLAGTPGLSDAECASYCDGYGHPSPKGAALMAEVMRPAIERALAQAP